MERTQRRSLHHYIRGIRGVGYESPCSRPIRGPPLWQHRLQPVADQLRSSCRVATRSHRQVLQNVHLNIMINILAMVMMVRTTTTTKMRMLMMMMMMTIVMIMVLVVTRR